MACSSSSGGAPDLLKDDWPEILEYAYLFGHAERRRGAYYDALGNLHLRLGHLVGEGWSVALEDTLEAVKALLAAEPLSI